jgi:heat shock protein HslJ
MIKRFGNITAKQALWAAVVAAIALGVIGAARPLSAADEGELAALDLEGTSWTLVSIGEQAALPGREITAGFTEGRVSGSAGCNHYFAGYELDGDALTISPVGMTEMMCMGPSGVMEQEGAFAAALGAAQSVRIDGDTLEIVYDEGSLIFNAQ